MNNTRPAQVDVPVPEVRQRRPRAATRLRAPAHERLEARQALLGGQLVRRRPRTRCCPPRGYGHRRLCRLPIRAQAADHPCARGATIRLRTPYGGADDLPHRNHPRRRRRTGSPFAGRGYVARIGLYSPQHRRPASRTPIRSHLSRTHSLGVGLAGQGRPWMGGKWALILEIVWVVTWAAHGESTVRLDGSFSAAPRSSERLVTNKKFP